MDSDYIAFEEEEEKEVATVMAEEDDATEEEDGNLEGYLGLMCHEFLPPEDMERALDELVEEVEASEASLPAQQPPADNYVEQPGTSGCSLAEADSSDDVRVKNRLWEYGKKKQKKTCSHDFVHSTMLQEGSADHNRTRGGYTCASCDKSFVSIYFLKRHLQIQHNEREQIKCHTCSKAFPTDSELMCHIGTHPDDGVSSSTCDVCDGMFRRRVYPAGKGADYAVRRFTCTTCYRSFACKQLLEFHSRTHHVQVFICVPCNKSFSNKRSLQRHKNIALAHTLENLVACNTCRKEFHSTKDLTHHMYAHAMEYPILYAAMTGQY